MNVTTLVDILVEQRDNHVDGSVYKAVQCDLAYSSNRIEGSRLSHDQTVMIFDGHDFSGTAPVDDIVEMANHFRLFDRMLDHVGQEIDGAYLCELHGILKRVCLIASKMRVGDADIFPYFPRLRCQAFLCILPG